MGALGVVLALALASVAGAFERTCNEVECKSLEFPYDSGANKYTSANAINGDPPFAVRPGCDALKQQCLFVRDDAFQNLRLAADGDAFPTFVNRGHPSHPSVEEIMAHGEIVYDAESTMYVAGIGLYKGPAGISEYRVIPHEDVGGEWFHVVNETFSHYNPILAATPATSSIYIETYRAEAWRAYAGTNRAIVNTTWKISTDFYPCSTVKRAESLSFPDFTAAGFSDSALVDGSIEMVCAKVMDGCGDYPQYDSFDDCVAFLSGLPHHDATCNAKYGSEYTGEGYSFFCKYIHHFMIDFSPQLHCFHAGPGDRGPDANGKHKCSVDQCAADVYSSARTCEDGEAEEIATGTVNALLYCLPALDAGPAAVGANCTQAVNTFLGRFAANGALCACADAVSGVSAVLDALDVDALTLIGVARAGPYALAFDAPACLADATTTCPDPFEIATRRGCATFDWERLVATMEGEWNGKRRDTLRITTDNEVASAECAVFSTWLGWRAAPPAVDSGVSIGVGTSAALSPPRMRALAAFLRAIPGGDVRIFPNPTGAEADPLVFRGSHAEVLAATVADQRRSSASRMINVCEGGPFDLLQRATAGAVPPVQSTGTAAHAGGVGLRFEIFGDALSAPSGADDPPTYAGGAYDRSRAGGDLLTAVWVDGFRKLYGLGSPAAWAAMGPKFADDVAGLVGLLLVAETQSEGWHRARGYAFAAAYRSTARVVGAALLEDGRRAADLTSAIADRGLDTEASAEQLAGFAAPLDGVALNAMNVLEFLRQDPCRLWPLWDADSTAFIVEFLRLSGLPGFRAAPGGEPFHHFDRAAANHDPAVFPDPNAFDPTRDNSDALVFNAREGDVGDPSAPSMKRVCPGRAFAIRTIRETVDAHREGTACARGNVKRKGVCFETALKAYGDGRRLSVDEALVDCARPAGNRADRALFLYLGAAEDPPSTFAQLVKHVAKGHGTYHGRASEHWVLRPPGIGAGATPAASCAIADDAKALKGLLERLRRDGYEKVYLVGHGVGSRAVWHAADISSRKLLAGAVVFEPHPHVVHAAYASRPASPRDLALLSPVVGGAYYAADDYALWRNRTVADDYETRRHLTSIGAAGLRCRLAENYAYYGGRIVPRDAAAHHVDPSVDVLMVDALRDGIYEGVNARAEYLASYALVHVKNGQLLDYYLVEGAGENGVLTSRVHAREVGRYVGRFTALAEARRYSLFYCHSRALKLPGSEYAAMDGLSSYALLYTLMLAFVILAACIGLEVGVGGVLLSSPHSRDLWLGAQVLMVPLVIAAFVSQSYLGIPLMIVGTFKFGFPEVTSALYRAFAPKNAHKSRIQRFLMLANGVAFIVHHFAGILFFCCLLAHLARATEVAALVPLAAQHMISFLKYMNYDVVCCTADETRPGQLRTQSESLADIGKVFGGIGGATSEDEFRAPIPPGSNTARFKRRSIQKVQKALGRARERNSHAKTLYTVLTLTIEFWFQFEVYAFYPAVSLLPRVSLFLLLSSHYIWLGVGIGGMCVNVGPKPKVNARKAGHWGFPTDFADSHWASRIRAERRGSA